MREINIKLTEQVLTTATGYTVEEIANANGYQEVVANPAYIVTVDENGITSGNGEAVTIPNPESRVRFLGRISATQAVAKLAEPLRKKVIADAQKQAEQAFDTAVQEVVDNTEVNIVE